MAWTYILECGDGTLYVGSTVDLEARLQQHADGRGGDYTRRRLPVSLVWSAEFDRIDEAWAMERRLHGWGRAKKDALIRGDFPILPFLARRRTRSNEGAG